MPQIRVETERLSSGRRARVPAAWLERSSGVPLKYSLPATLGLLGLLAGGLGESTDIAYHVDFGRDDNLFTVPHTLILLGIGTIALAGLLALLLRGPASPGSVRVRGRDLPPGALVVLVCSALALAAFPLDGTWHALFGEDLTLWSPTHLLLLGGPTLAILGMLLLLREGSALGRPTRLARAGEVAFAGVLLLALTDFQSEFAFGVPQFRLLYHPLTVAMTAGFALVFARGLLGRLGALKALTVFYVLAALPLLAGVFEPERSLDRAPLYLAEALIVELVALRPFRDRLVQGALAGLGCGSIGLAAEWAWTHLWMPFPWGPSLLPEAALLAPLGGAAAGVVGARLALAFQGRPPERVAGRLPAGAAVAAALLVGVFVLALPLPREGSSARATVVPFDTAGGSTSLRIRLDPPDAAQGADWFRVAAFHGGSAEQVELREASRGVYVTDRQVPVGRERDVVLRLARGPVLASVTVASAGLEHGEERVPLARRSQRFEAEHALPPVGGFKQDLQRVGYALVSGIALFWLFCVWRALGLLEGRPLRPRWLATKR